VDEYARELTARMKGENVSFFALYDKQGEVIRSDYQRKNVALPTCLLAYLIEGEYQDWQITDSEMEMKDFDPKTIQYHVLLENGRSKKTAVFDFEFISKLHARHQDLVRHSLY
jgi:hypothetical protein